MVVAVPQVGDPAAFSADLDDADIIVWKGDGRILGFLVGASLFFAADENTQALGVGLYPVLQDAVDFVHKKLL